MIKPAQFPAAHPAGNPAQRFGSTLKPYPERYADASQVTLDNEYRRLRELDTSTTGNLDGFFAEEEKYLTGVRKIIDTHLLPVIETAYGAPPPDRTKLAGQLLEKLALAVVPEELIHAITRLTALRTDFRDKLGILDGIYKARGLTQPEPKKPFDFKG